MGRGEGRRTASAGRPSSRPLRARSSRSGGEPRWWWGQKDLRDPRAPSPPDRLFARSSQRRSTPPPTLGEGSTDEARLGERDRAASAPFSPSATNERGGAPCGTPRSFRRRKNADGPLPYFRPSPVPDSPNRLARRRPVRHAVRSYRSSLIADPPKKRPHAEARRPRRETVSLSPRPPRPPREAIFLWIRRITRRQRVLDGARRRSMMPRPPGESPFRPRTARRPRPTRCPPRSRGRR
jgi:hypothetical protein